MARLISRPFDPTQPVYARRFFVAAGRHYNPGDHFDWQRLSVAQRRVFLLYEAGKLTHDTHAETVAPTPKPAASPAPKPIEQDVQDGDLPTTAIEPAPEDPTDELDDLSMKDLRVIAEAEGAPYRTSRELQRQAIREHRDGSTDA